MSTSSWIWRKLNKSKRKLKALQEQIELYEKEYQQSIKDQKEYMIQWRKSQ